ncbi:MAG TPA: class IV adenylate cyclase [Candidatus Sulfotelmatobacter sp.]|jgi:adenylate cyclase class 2
MPQEVEIKFRVASVRGLEKKLSAAKFRLLTPRTHEMNTLYDLPGKILRNRKELLRIRKYGKKWTVTHKSGSTRARHASRVELETQVEDGHTLDAIFRALGYSPSFRYEKFRSEWSDGKGQVVVDHTPIGDFCEIEGPPRWIDQTAKKLGVNSADYITKNYATLFAEWRESTKSNAQAMTFAAVAGDPEK